MKSWNYLNHLSKNHSVSCACFLKNEDANHREEFLKAIDLNDFYSESLQIKRSPVNLLKSYIKSSCLNVFRNYSNSFKIKIEQLAALHDILLIDHYEMFQYVPKNYPGKVVLHTHNAEFMLWQRMSELATNPIKKLVLKYEATRVRNYESEIFSRADLIYSTPADIELYKKHDFETDKHQMTYHLGNESLLELPDLKFEETEKAITFMGTMSWEPNIDGLEWFLQTVWPQIKKQEKDCKLYLLGKVPDSRIIKAANNDSNILFPGFVKDLDSYLKKTRVYIAPLRFGSGMKVKVLEGLYRGNPTVSTTVGAEGLSVTNGEEILIADNYIDFTNHCLTLLNNKELWNKISSKSRIVADKEYRWEPLFEKMDLSLSESYS